MMDYRDNRLYRQIIYLTFQLVAIDLDSTKQIWYEKHFPNQLLITYESENLTKEAQKIIAEIKRN